MTYPIWNGKRCVYDLSKLPHWHGSLKHYLLMMVSLRVRSSMCSLPHIARSPDLNRFSTCYSSATSDFTPNHFTVTPYQNSTKKVSYLPCTYGWTAIRKTGMLQTCKKSLPSHHDDCPVPKFTTKHCFGSIVWLGHGKHHKYHGSMSITISTIPLMGCAWRLPLCRQHICFKRIGSHTYQLSILRSSWHVWMWNYSKDSFRISVWALRGLDVTKMRPIPSWPLLLSSMPFRFVWFLVYWLNRDSNHRWVFAYESWAFVFVGCYNSVYFFFWILGTIAYHIDMDRYCTRAAGAEEFLITKGNRIWVTIKCCISAIQDLGSPAQRKGM